MYLSSNSCPYISLNIHQCACFTHVTCQTHAKAVKHIICYIKVTEDKGLIIKHSQNLQVECYINADFSGLWGVDKDQNTIFVKSRTSFIIMFMGCPLTWVYKLQYQIPLITMEAEYIESYQLMRELIIELIKYIQTFFISEKTHNPKYRTQYKSFFLGDIPP